MIGIFSVFLSKFRKIHTKQYQIVPYRVFFWKTVIFQTPYFSKFYNKSILRELELLLGCDILGV